MLAHIAIQKALSKVVNKVVVNRHYSHLSNGKNFFHNIEYSLFRLTWTPLTKNCVNFHCEYKAS